MGRRKNRKSRITSSVGGTLGTSYIFEDCDSIEVYKEFAWNCQMQCIGGIDMILGLNDKHKAMSKILEYAKPLILVDINIELFKKTKQLFKEYNYYVYKKLPYVSTNESNMIIIIFKNGKD